MALNPYGTYHFYTGRLLAARLGYDGEMTSLFPDEAVESFADVANPFYMRSLDAGERVIDIGSGGGFVGGASGEKNARSFC